MNTKNLIKLRDELIPSIPDQLFDMEQYRGYEDNGHVCNSPGCLLGWTPKLMPKKEVEEMIDWSGSIRFGRLDVSFYGLDGDESLFLFNSGNPSIKTDSIARINYLLEHGQAPKDWQETWKIVTK